MVSDLIEELTKALTDAIWRNCAGRPADVAMQALARVTAIVVSVGCDRRSQAEAEIADQARYTEALVHNSWDKFEDERAERKKTSG